MEEIPFVQYKAKEERSWRLFESNLFRGQSPKTKRKTKQCEFEYPKVRNELSDIRFIVSHCLWWTATIWTLIQEYNCVPLAIPAAKEREEDDPVVCPQLGNRKLIALEMNGRSSFLIVRILLYNDYYFTTVCVCTDEHTATRSRTIYSLLNVTRGRRGLIYGSDCLFLFGIEEVREEWNIWCWVMVVGWAGWCGGVGKVLLLFISSD